MPQTDDKHKKPTLPDKQRRFIDEYLIDSNAARAAIAVGYSEKAAKQTGYRLLQIPAHHTRYHHKQKLPVPYNLPAQLLRYSYKLR